MQIASLVHYSDFWSDEHMAGLTDMEINPISATKFPRLFPYLETTECVHNKHPCALIFRCFSSLAVQFLSLAYSALLPRLLTLQVFLLQVLWLMHPQFSPWPLWKLTYAANWNSKRHLKWLSALFHLETQLSYSTLTSFVMRRFYSFVQTLDFSWLNDVKQMVNSE